MLKVWLSISVSHIVYYDAEYRNILLEKMIFLYKLASLNILKFSNHKNNEPKN